MKKKSVLFLLAGSLLLAGCQTDNTNSSVSSQKDTQTTSSVTPDAKIAFDKESYEVNSGDKVTVTGNVTGVTYSFQGGTPTGVTLDSSTGEITFDAYGETIPEATYIAVKGSQTASTVVKFVMKEEAPAVTISNVSKYLVDGDYVYGKAITSKGREYAVTYSIKDDLAGITINDKGRVSFGESITDGTNFTVICESKGVSQEMAFIAMKANIITAANEVIIEKGKQEDAYFTLDFNGNTAGKTETKQADVKLYLDNVLQNVDLTYNEETGEIKIPSTFISTLGAGEHAFQVTTKRNAVSLSLAIADKIIYDVETLVNIFEADYSGDTPTFKEGSLAGYYALGCDLDFASYLAKNAWAPIGAYSDEVFDIPFTGTFNGNGYALKNFTYGNLGAVAGLFGRNKGTVKNFSITGEISTVRSWSGVVVGNNAGTIKNIIADVKLINSGEQSATGIITSTNHGTIENCISLNANAKGNINPDITWRQSGIVVGLNETDGSIKNCYAVGAEGQQIFGSSNNSEVTIDNCGKMFTTLEALNAYDFSFLPSANFKVVEGGSPTLKVLSIPHTPGVFEFTSMPQYGMKGNSVPLAMTIKPVERQEEYASLVTYSFVGDDYGATISGGTLDLTNLNVPEAGGNLTIKASLSIAAYGVDLSKQYTLPVYNAIGGLTITNQETTITSGDSLKIGLATTPTSEVVGEFSATCETAWKSCYFSMEGDTLTVKDDCPADLEITVSATAIGETVKKTFTTKELHTYLGNNVVHYKDEATNDFVYAIPSNVTEISSLTLDGMALDASQYSFADGSLTLKKEAITDTGVQHVLKAVTGTGDAYRLFAAIDSGDKVDETWLNNAFGADGYKKISSMEDFKKYFAFDGATHTDLSSNFSQSAVYVLTADLDFSSESFETIGKDMLGVESNQIFNGKFYGMGHSIKNITISKEAGSWTNAFFAQIGGEGIGAVFQDVNFENVSITTGGGQFSGVVSAFVGDSAIIKNVNAYNCTVAIGSDTPFNHSLANGGLFGKSWSTSSYCTYNGYNINLIGLKG